MPYVTAADGAQIFYREWGEGRPVVLSLLAVVRSLA
jgi:non-heme chloroperoxidase